jgi:hypothetical protein
VSFCKAGDLVRREEPAACSTSQSIPLALGSGTREEDIGMKPQQLPLGLREASEILCSKSRSLEILGPGPRYL